MDLGDAARVGQVGLCDGDARGEHRQELRTAVEPFTGGEGHRARGHQPGEQTAVLGYDRLLHEQRVEGGQFGQDAAGPGGGEAAVEVNGPWKSTATSRSGPSASRAAAKRSTTAAVSAAVGIGEVTPAPFIYTAVKPASTCAAIRSDSSAGSSPPTQAYTRTRSRTGPPSRACTGAP